LPLGKFPSLCGNQRRLTLGAEGASEFGGGPRAAFWTGPLALEKMGRKKPSPMGWAFMKPDLRPSGIATVD
jgi:hypothetical protein